MTNISSAEQPIMIFDSGIGGLSVFEAARQKLPGAPIIYVADYAAYPYGTKSEAALMARVPALLGRLVERYHPRLLTIACNTASTIALSAIRDALDIPVVGTVPAIRPAASLTQSGVIGLLGTEATIRQPYVDRLAADFAADKYLLRFGAPALVDAAEAKLRGETPDEAIFHGAWKGLNDQMHGGMIDTVVLACTHFPLVEDELAKAAGRPIKFIDGAAGIARRMDYLLNDQTWAKGPLDHEFITTGDLSDLDIYRPALASRFGFTKFGQLGR